MDLKASLSLRDNFTNTLKRIDSSLTKSANEMARFDSASAAFGTTFQKNVKSVVRESQTVEQAVKKMQTTMYNGFEDVNGKWRDMSGRFSKESVAIKAEAAAMAGEVRHQFERMKPPESTGNAFIDFFNRISHRAKDMASRMAQNFRQAMSQIPSVVQTGTSKIISLFGNLGNRVRSIDWMKGITEGIPKALSIVRNFVSNAVNLFKNMGNKMLTPLRAVTNGFRSMKDGASRYLDQVKAKFDSASQGVVSFTDRLKNAVKTFMVLKTLNSVINTVSRNLTSSFDRVDTLERYPRLLTAMGYTAEQAQGSMDKLSTGIKGLPTALDDIVATTQQMVVLTGNVEKATDLSLALNNSFLASGSSSPDASRGMVQFSQMLSRNEVDIISWRTLMETMPYALKEVGKSLGKASMWDLYDAIKSGEMTFEDLGDAFIRLNSEGGKLFEMAKEQSRGFANSMALIGFSFERGFANITMGINQRLRDLGLPDIPQMLANFAGKIDNVFEWLVPRVPAAVDKVIAGFNKMKEIGGIIKDFLPDMPEIPWLNKVLNPFKKFTNNFSPISDLWSKFNTDIADSFSGLHKVVSGDNLWALAEKYYGDGTMWNKIYEANKNIIDDPWWIFPDQEFKIPGISISEDNKNPVKNIGDKAAGWFDRAINDTVAGYNSQGKITLGDLFNFEGKGFKEILGESFSGLSSMGENHEDVSKLALGLLSIKPAATAAKFGFDLLLFGLTKHPFAIATAAILGLATGMGYLYENNEGFKKGFDETLTTVRQSRLFTQLESSISKVGESFGGIEWGDIFTDPGKVGGQIWSSLTTLGGELVRVSYEISSTIMDVLSGVFNNINWGDATVGAINFVKSIGSAIAEKMPTLGASTGALVGSMINAGKDILNTFSNTILGLEPDDPLTTEKLLRAMWKGSGDLLGWATEVVSGFGVAFMQALREELTGQTTPTAESQKQDLTNRAEIAKNTPKQSRTGSQNATLIEQDFAQQAQMNVVNPLYDTHSRFGPMLMNPTDDSVGRAIDTGTGEKLGNADYGTFWGNMWTGLKNSVAGTVEVWSGAGNSLREFFKQDVRGPSGKPIQRNQTTQPPHSPGPIMQPIDTRPTAPGTAPMQPISFNNPLTPKTASAQEVQPKIASVGKGLSPAKPRSEDAPTISTEPIQLASRTVQTATQAMGNNVQTANTNIVQSTGTAFSGIQSSVSSGMTGMGGSVTLGNSQTQSSFGAMRSSVTTTTSGAMASVSSLTTSGMFGMSGSVASGNSQSQTSFSGMRSSVTSTTGSAMSSVGSLAAMGMLMFSGSVGAGMLTSVGFTRSGTGSMVAVVGSMRGGMYSAGLYSMMGLASGINAGAGAAISAAASVASRVRSTITSALRISSPSRVMEQIGLWITQGLARGITFGTGFVEKASQRIAGYSISTPEVSFAGAGVSGGSSTTIHKSIGNITINIDGTQDAKVVAQEVIDMINDAFDSDLE